MFAFFGLGIAEMLVLGILLIVVPGVIMVVVAMTTRKSNQGGPPSEVSLLRSDVQQLREEVVQLRDEIERLKRSLSGGGATEITSR